MIAVLILSLAQQVSVPCPQGAREPQLSVGADGHVALGWGTAEALYCCYGEPGSESFHIVHRVAHDLRFAIGMRRGPRVAIFEGDHVVMTAIGGEEGGGKDGDLYAWRNMPKVSGWREPVRINSVPGSAREGLQALSRSEHEKIYCAWIDLRSGKPQIYGALSEDRGQTWTDESLVSKEAEICPCCAPSVAFDTTGRVYVMWRGVHNGSRDMQIASPGGEATKLGSGTWKLDACPMDGGALAPAADGGMLTVWRREKQVFSARVGASETLIGAGEQPWIGGSTIVWLEKRGGKLFALASGAKEPAVLDSSANDPVIAAQPHGKGALYAAWETGEGDATQIRLQRLP